MLQVGFPYGNEEIVLDIPDEKLVGVYAPRERAGVAGMQTAVARALAEPIKSARLRDIARGRKTAAVVVDDVSRPVPNNALLPPLFEEMESGGVALKDVTVIVATGLHRPLTDQELDAIRGDLPLRVVNHDAHDEKNLVSLGHTFLGQELRINRLFAEADLKVLVGDVEYHQFCGYGGGAKSVYPGLADAASIRHNHSMMEMEGTGPGRIEGNPVRREIDEAGRMAGVDFLLSVVMNSAKEVVCVHAGDPYQAFLPGTKVVDEMYRVEVEAPADLVITSPGGFPKDIDLYQSQKAVTAGRRIVKKGGTIVTLAECREGHGSDLFDAWMNEAETIDDVIERIRKEFVMGGHKAYQFAREIKWARVCLLSSLDPEKVRTYFMHPLTGPAEIQCLIAEARSVAARPPATLTLAEIFSRGNT